MMPYHRKLNILYINIFAVFIARVYSIQLKGTTGHYSLGEQMERSTDITRNARQGNFIRIGRPSVVMEPFDRKLHSTSKYILKEKVHGLFQLFQWYPHLHRFIRIGRSGSQSYTKYNHRSLKEIGPQEIFELIDNEMKNNRSNPSQRASNVVKNRRVGLKSIYQFIPKVQLMNVESGKNDQSFDGLGRILVNIPQEIKSSHDYNGNFVSKRMLSDQAYDRKSAKTVYGFGKLENVDKLDKRASGFIRIGKGENESLKNRFRHPYVNISKYSRRSNINFRTVEAEKRSLRMKYHDNGKGEGMAENVANNGKRASTFIRIGRFSGKHDNKRMSKPSQSFKKAGNHRLNHFNYPENLSLNKRSYISPPRYSEALKSNIETAISDDPVDTTNRRSAFVRIGKIPSSAFVRIGKNFDHFIQVPITSSRRYLHHFRKGQSSFVRIG